MLNDIYQNMYRLLALNVFERKMIFYIYICIYNDRNVLLFSKHGQHAAAVLIVDIIGFWHFLVLLLMLPLFFMTMANRIDESVWIYSEF